jgi:hypothetical protein
MSTAWLRALTVAMALAVAGCGGDDERASAPRTTTQAAPVYAPVTIEAPARGAKLSATLDDTGGLTTRATVRGTARSHTDVLVTSGCNRNGCAVTTTSDEHGRFTARVVLAASLDAPQVAVTAEYGYQVPVRRSDRIELRLRMATSGRGSDAKRERARLRSDELADIPDELDTGDGATGSTTGGSGGPGRLVMVGDSLAQGTEPHLPSFLPGWRITTDARRGRPLAEGMRVMASMPRPSSPTVLTFSLFTNDMPTNVDALEDAVRASVERAGSGCAVWATIVRPPLNGVSYRAANRRLEQLAGQLTGLRVVPWAAAVAENGALLAADGVHATPDGYKARAQMYAQAAQTC